MGEREETMAGRPLGMGMLETSPKACVSSLSVHPSEGGQMEKGLQVNLEQIMCIIAGVALGVVIAKADWSGLWWK